MLVTADQFYGVLFNNQKISSIRHIKREEAQEFVDQVCGIHRYDPDFVSLMMTSIGRRLKHNRRLSVMSGYMISNFRKLFNFVICYVNY